jgi:AcrR family transcriptional regulator
MESSTVTSPGLRERKKQATRTALYEAALRLALERGVDKVTIEDISEAAGVSSRTFSNYFSSKEEALLGETHAHFPDDALEAFTRGQPTGELLTDLHALLKQHLARTALRREDLLARRQLIKSNPTLLPLFHARMAKAEQALIQAVATRTGTDSDGAYPQLVAALASATMRLSFMRWTGQNASRSLADHLDELFDLLRRGL